VIAPAPPRRLFIGKKYRSMRRAITRSRKRVRIR